MPKREAELQKLARLLTGLAESEPTKPEDLSVWTARADEISDIVTESLELQKVPHVFWHYIADVDIRLRDPRYAENQRRQIGRLLEHLRLGVMPTDADLW